MHSYILSCCSTADMPESWYQEREVNVCYFHLRVGDDEYLDDFGHSISTSELYRRMVAGERSQTSQVNVEEYIERFHPYLEAGKDILHVTLSSGISGTLNSARIAAEDLKEEFPERKIYIVDSLCASSGYGLLMDKLCDLRDDGMDIDALRDYAETAKHKVQHLVLTTDLKFLIMGGRVSKASGAIATILNICPLIEVVKDGSLKVKEKLRGKRKAIARLEEKMEELTEDGLEYSGSCFIGNSECEEDAEKLREMIEERFPHLKGKIRIYPIGPTIGCHTGPGTLVVFFFGKERTE